jgi:hypothetical protein
MLIRRTALLVLIPFALLLTSTALAQTAPIAIADELKLALSGRWTGVLEYRDYKEPATSLKRIALPTWLSVQASGASQSWHYIYDDGPNKVVEEDEQVTFDMAQNTITMTEHGKAPLVYRVAGFSMLKAGRGTLVLTGNITDNNKPAEARLTLTIGRNIVDLLQEVRPAATQDTFAFRHEYRFVRSEAPVPTAK